MTALRAFAVDDEPLALNRLSRALARMDDVDLVGSSTSARASLELIDRLRPDMLFLDIAMPGLDGFDVVERLDPAFAPAVVFVTAHDEHAVRAFAISAVDYLLKPVAPERLRDAIGRARTVLGAREAEQRLRDLRRTIAELRQPAEDSDAGTLWAHRHRELVRIPLDAIEWAKAEGDYVRLHTAEGGGLMRLTLAALEARLSSEQFIRVHRSAICRRKAVMSLRRRPTGALALTLGSGDEVPVGRSYAAGIRHLLRRMRDD